MSERPETVHVDLPFRIRIQPWRLLRSFIAVARDPENTADGARIVMSFDGAQSERNYQRFCADPRGARFLDEGPNLFELLTDRRSLLSLPSGSLGRSFVRFMDAEGIRLEALDREVAPIEEELWRPSPRRRRYLRHMRANHDLWHLLTGYSRDLFGEMLLLRFSWVQLGTPMFGVLTRTMQAGVDRRIPGATALLAEAEERARRIPWLPTLDWAQLLARPIDAVRDEIGLGPPPTYTRYVRRPRGFGLMPLSADAKVPPPRARAS